MKICIFTSSYPDGPGDGRAAAGTFVRDFALSLARQDVRVFVCTQAGEAGSEDSPPVSVTRFAWRGSRKPLSRLNPLNPGELASIVSLCRNGVREALALAGRERPDLCLAMWAFPGGYFANAVWKKLGIPYAVWVLGDDIWLLGKVPVVRSRVRDIIRGAAYRFADGRLLAAEVEELSGSRCEFLPSARARTSAQASGLHDVPGTARFVFIGRWEHRKGADTAVEAMRLLLACGYRAVLHLVGGGSLERRLRQRIRRCGLERSVLCPGYLSPEAAGAYIRDSDCVLIPSRRDSIPLVFSEAVTAGVPVIVADVGDMGALVREYGNGEVVKPGDAAALCGAMIRMMEKPPYRTPEGPGQLRELFDLDRIAGRFLDLAVPGGGPGS